MHHSRVTPKLLAITLLVGAGCAMALLVGNALLTLAVVVVGIGSLFWYARKQLAQTIEAMQDLQKSLDVITSELETRGDSISKETVAKLEGVKPLKRLVSAVQAGYSRIAAAKNTSDVIYDQMGQGILRFGKDLAIKHNYSKFLMSIFGNDFDEGKSVIEYVFARTDLTQDVVRQMNFHLRSLFGMEKLQWTVSSMNFVNEAVVFHGKRKVEIRFNYFPAYVAGRIEEISIVVQDITQYNHAKKQADHRQKEMEKIFSLLQVSDALFQTFMEETYHLFDLLKEDAKVLRNSTEANYREAVDRMFRHIHTLKGNSRLFKMSSIQNVAHDVETFLSKLREGSVRFDQSSLITLMSKLMEINQELYSYTSLRRDILGGNERANQATMNFRVQWLKSLVAQFTLALRDPRIESREVDRIQWELNRVLSSFDKISISEYVNRYDMMIVELAAKHGVRVKPIVRRLECRYFDAHTVSLVNDMIGHLIRNSLGHGIETKDERISLGKNPEGSIWVETSDCDGMVTVSVADDGRGLDRDKILQKAIALGLTTEAESTQLTDQEIYAFIFHPGLTVDSVVTELSGRGVGMDAVRSIVEEIAGTIEVESKPHAGTKFLITFPEVKERWVTANVVFDVKACFQAVFDEFSAFFGYSNTVANLTADDSDHYFVYGDRLGTQEVLKYLCLELVDSLPANSSIYCTLLSKSGQRILDSFEYFRLRLTPKAGGQDGMLKSIHQDSYGVKRASEILRKSNGSLRVLPQSVIEINLPSNMPVKAFSFTFKIRTFVHDFERTKELLEQYFESEMAGWPVEVESGQGRRFEDTSEEEVCQIYIVAEELVKNFEQARPPALRQKDHLIIVSASREGLDEPDSFLLLPSTAIFIPRPIQRGDLANALESLILKNFAQGTMELSQKRGLGLAAAS